MTQLTVFAIKKELSKKENCNCSKLNNEGCMLPNSFNDSSKLFSQTKIGGRIVF